MTPLEQIKFAAQIKIGSQIELYYKMTLVVTEITDKKIIGFAKERFDKTGKKEIIALCYATITNPHYNKNLKIVA